MKLLVVGDLHGNKPNIHLKDFDAIIAPGDFCSDESRKHIFESLRKQRDNPDFKAEWWDMIGRKKAKQMLEKSLRDGRKILEFLNSFGKPVFLVPGNWDQTGMNEYEWQRVKQDNWPRLIKGLRNLRDVHFKKRSFGGFDIIGYGIVSGPEIPQYKEDKKGLTKSELRKQKNDYETKKKRLLKLFQRAKNPAIFIPHNVPFNTRLDKITNKESPKYGFHYGSVIARELIERYQPLLCIGGHMHEHFGKCKIGKTICINAGFGSKVNTLIDLDEERREIISIKFYPRTYG